jgi:hypothetical protein
MSYSLFKQNPGEKGKRHVSAAGKFLWSCYNLSMHPTDQPESHRHILLQKEPEKLVFILGNCMSKKEIKS